jgi:hypothetical protein
MDVITSLDGTGYQVAFRATDNAGNTANISTDTFKIDQTAPVITYDPTTGTYNTDISVIFDATDNLSGFENGLTEWLAFLTESTNGDGTYNFSVSMSDLAGNLTQIIAGPFNILLPPIPPPPLPPLSDGADQSASKDKVAKAYWEILDPYRFVSVDATNQTQTFYLYHPLRETDDSAFGDINIDADTYEFIQDGIDLKKKLNPYFSLLDDKEAEKSEPAA